MIISCSTTREHEARSEMSKRHDLFSLYFFLKKKKTHRSAYF